MTPSKDLSAIQQSLLSRQISVINLVDQYLKRIAESDSLNIYVEVYAEEVREKARLLDQKIQHNPSSLGKLFGAVFSIKDVICQKGHGTTAASKMLEGFVSTYSSTAVQKILDEDALIIGRTNCDEFAMGSTNENSIYGPTKNGLDTTRVPGGSSGAAAVSVQQETCLIALGSDTGGSVRQPAAYCGVLGFKPTYGRISRYGLIAYASSFDQIGIIGHQVRDIGKVLQVIEGYDPMDATSSKTSPTREWTSDETTSFSVAYLKEVMEHNGLDAEIKKNLNDVIHRMRSYGSKVSEESFSLLDYLVPTYYVLTTAEASSNLSRYDGLRYGYSHKEARDIHDKIVKTRTEGFGMEVKRRIMMGTFVLSVGYFDAYFLKAQKVRQMIVDQIDKLFEQYDFLLLPTASGKPPLLGESMSDPVKMYLSDIFTVLANLGGYPAISIPVHPHAKGLSTSYQLIAKSNDESRLLHFAGQLTNMA